ncbi:MAG: flagellin [Pseudomonadota bacterium]
MSSILNNVSAQNALRTLQMTNKNLETTSDRISSGLKVATASDNAAYWSIATTMKSDSSSLSAVKDSLSLGANIAKSAYDGLDQTKDLLGKIKDKLTTAAGEGVDRVAIQSEIAALKEQLSTVAKTSSFSGQNWLEVATTGAKSIVSSVSRDASNKLSVGTIDTNTSNFALYTTTGDSGILDQDITLTSFNTTGGAIDLTTTPADVTFTGAEKVTFNVSLSGGTNREVTVDNALVTSTLGGATVIASKTDLKLVLEAAFNKAGISGITVDTSGANTVIQSDEAIKISGLSNNAGTVDFASMGLANEDITTATAAGFTKSVDDIDISASNSTEVTNYLKVVDEALTKVTTAATKLGAIQTRIDTQKELVSSLTDTINTGVSLLVDADMEEESTRLKALQTQQQLGVQALSIANSGSQNILSLFR